MTRFSRKHWLGTGTKPRIRHWAVLAACASEPGVKPLVVLPNRPGGVGGHNNQSGFTQFGGAPPLQKQLNPGTGGQ